MRKFAMIERLGAVGGGGRSGGLGSGGELSA